MIHWQLCDRVLLACLAGALALAGCSLGRVHVRETHYLAVTNGQETNYYRLRVDAATVLGVAGYRSGWFPARSVDRLMGEVSSESAPDELQARTELERLIIAKIKATHQRWLEMAEKPDADREKLRELNEARRRVLAYPAFRAQPFDDTIEIEYNPARDLVTFHADDKLVFVVSSNPDEVIRQIASFVEEDKTVLTINRLAGTITQLRVNEVAGLEAAQELDKANDVRLRQVIQQTLQAVPAGTSRPNAAFRLDVLVGVLEALSP